WDGNDPGRWWLAAGGSGGGVARPPGRRALGHVAGSGFPVALDRSDGFSPWCVTWPCERTGVYNVLTDTANLYGYAIYAVDVEGRDPDQNWGREKRLHAVLGELARVTGGKRLLNGGRRRMLQMAVEDTSSYYSIAVTPPPGAPELRMAVDIEMLRQGLEARSQTAFVPLSAQRDRELDILAALWLEEGAQQSPLGLRLDHVERLSGGRMRIAGHLLLPAGLLQWRSDGDRTYAEVTVEVASVDWRGDSSAVAERRMILYRLAGEETMQMVLPWPLELRRRRHTIVAGLRDHLGGRSYTAVAEIAPRDPPRRAGLDLAKLEQP
ncbi:MAG: hypothetical protein O7A04_09260, partial [Acidobacteria bacterium]|nr:hypothetical protein [Acidobacteriota bacterium]